MFEYIISRINEISTAARENYGVNPIVFLVIYLASVPVFYYSLFRTLRAIAKKLANEIMIWSAIFLSANLAPFLYVMIFGRNIPWWVYLILIVLVGQGILALFLKLRKNPASDSKTTKERKS